MMTWLAPISSSSFAQGLLSNIVHIDHLCFALMIGLMVFHFIQKQRLLASALAGNAIGLGIGIYWGALPATQFLVGLSLVLLVLLVTASEQWRRYLSLSLIVIGILHGVLHAQRFGQFGNAETSLSFAVGVLLSLALLAVTFSLILKILYRNPKGLAPEVEHILIAVTSGSALAYLVMAFS